MVSDKTEGSRHLPRLYINSVSSSSSTEHPNVPLRAHSLVPLTVDQEHYLLDVMRITNSKRWGRNKKQQNDDGDDVVDYTGCVRIFNGIDGEWLAKVVVEDPSGTNGNKKQRRKRGGKQTNSDDSSSGTVVECLEQLVAQPSGDSNTLSVHLYLGYLKDKQRRRWVFEKGTELGMDGITILETDFSSNAECNFKSKDFRWEDDRDKHKLHVIEAAEQCERLTVPEISQEARSIPSIVGTIVSADTNDHNDIWLVCRERSKTSPPILSALQDLWPTISGITTTIHVLVGPEGGWSPEELETFSNLKRVHFVSLGSSVLRAETAAITAVASIQMYQERMF